MESYKQATLNHRLNLMRDNKQLSKKERNYIACKKYQEKIRLEKTRLERLRVESSSENFLT